MQNGVAKLEVMGSYEGLNRYISLLNAELCHIENLFQSDRQRGQIRDVDFRHHSIS